MPVREERLDPKTVDRLPKLRYMSSHAFSVACPHHGGHAWKWCGLGLQQATVEYLRKWAGSRMYALCPDIGNVLSWEPFRPDEPWDAINWSLRRNRGWVEDGEVVVAECVLWPNL